MSAVQVNGIIGDKNGTNITLSHEFLKNTKKLSSKSKKCAILVSYGKSFGIVRKVQKFHTFGGLLWL